MRVGPVPQFVCEWQCLCGSILGWSGAEALVLSQTGAHRHCPNCKQEWKITTNGATALAKLEVEEVGAAIQPPAIRDMEYANVQIPSLGGDVLDRAAMALDERQSPGREDSD